MRDRANPDDRTDRFDAFEESGHEYDAWFDTEGKIIFDIECESIRRVLPYLPRPWLEVGVGSGRFAQIIATEYGIDPSIGLLGIAKGRIPNIIRAYGEQIPLVERSIGGVFLITTLCFVKSPSDVLDEIHRILRPEGRITVGMIPSDSKWGKLYQSKKKGGHPVYRHANFQTYEQVCAGLNRNGFRVEQTLSTLFQSPGRVSKLEQPLEGYCRSAGFVVVKAGKSGAVE